MGFLKGNLFSISSLLLAGAQTCPLFEHDLMAARKSSKETKSELIASILFLSVLISNAIQLKDG